MIAFDWTPIRYRNVISVLKNPFYAGACIYGESEHRTAIVNGRAEKTYGHGKPFDEWRVMLLLPLVCQRLPAAPSVHAGLRARPRLGARAA